MDESLSAEEISPAPVKRRGKYCVVFYCSAYDANGIHTSYHFFEFPKDAQRRNSSCTLIKWQHGQNGFGDLLESNFFGDPLGCKFLLVFIVRLVVEKLKMVLLSSMSPSFDSGCLFIVAISCPACDRWKSMPSSNNNFSVNASLLSLYRYMSPFKKEMSTFANTVALACLFSFSI